MLQAQLNKVIYFIFFSILGIAVSEQLLACQSSNSKVAVTKDSTFYYRIPKDQLQPFVIHSNVKFWERVMTLNSDSVLVYAQSTRQILAVLPKSESIKFQDSCCKDSIFHNYRFNHQIPFNAPMRYLEGKSQFYQWEQVKNYIKPAGEVFTSIGVNPIYSQMVLLIECPANPKGRSIAGAVGHFQLMPFVAKKYGLKVSADQDERISLERGAYAAAMHFKQYCIPMANKILDKHNIMIAENELWYQLFVLHIYNAGAGNVAKVMDAIGHVGNGTDLITRMWQTSAGGFKNASQNYSQLALAAYLIFERKS